MKPNSFLKLKHVAWVAACALAAMLLFFATHSGAKPTAQAPPPPVVEVAAVEQKDVPIYGEWIGTLSGQVNADIKAQVTGYLLSRDYKEGSYVTKGQLLFDIDPRPFQAVLDQAKGQLAQAAGAIAACSGGCACGAERRSHLRRMDRYAQRTCKCGHQSTGHRLSSQPGLQRRVIRFQGTTAF